MKTIYYRESEKPKISCLLEITSVLSILCSKCENEDEKIFKEEDSSEILKKYNRKINMTEKYINQEFSLNNIDETRNYLIEKINSNELISKKHKNACATLNYTEHFLILKSFAITACVSISSFDSLVDIPMGITISAI